MKKIPRINIHTIPPANPRWRAIAALKGARMELEMASQRRYGKTTAMPRRKRKASR